MRKVWIIILLAFVSLGTALIWEYSYRTQTKEQRLKMFEHRLHREEQRVDHMLESLDSNGDISEIEWEGGKEVVLVAFQNGILKYWSDNHVGTPNLYKILKSGGNLVRINNVYYDIRRRSEGNKEFFALLFLKDDFPYTNKYLINRFNRAWGISVDNVGKINLYDTYREGLPIIYNRDGERLFQMESTVSYNDTAPGPFVLILYVIFLFLLFYAYGIALGHSSSFRVQLLYMLAFFACFAFIRVLMVQYQIPSSLYSFPIFKTDFPEWTLVLPVGDLLVTMLCITHFVYITLHKLRIDYRNARLIHYRYLFLSGFVLLAFLYTNFLHFSIHSLIEHTQISLNIAQFQDVNVYSIVAFVALVLGGMGLFVLVNGTVCHFRHLFSLNAVVIGVIGVFLSCTTLCYFFNFSLTPLECLFTLSLYFLFIFNVYVAKKDAQKSILTIALVVMSIYVTFLSKSSELHREITVRAKCATDIIREKDPVFEKKLEEVDQVIKGSVLLDSLVRSKNEVLVKDLILGGLTDLTGFHYNSNVVLCCKNDSSSVNHRTTKECYSYFNEIICKMGEKVDSTGFYHINDFDGLTTYIGRYVYSFPECDLFLYLRFDSEIGSESLGYAQILSKATEEDKSVIYPYSYAKYKDGVLISSTGDYNYYKYVEQFGRYNYEHVETIVKDGYSHMMIPVGNRGMFIISLNDNIFAFYYLNVLYAIFVCMIFSSYGIFFRIDNNEWDVWKRGTLKWRIKNNIISLVVVLFVVMTAMSIFVNSVSVERRHEMNVVKLSKYINKELERHECVEVARCPEIRNVLKRMADMLWVDINIYDQRGQLVATSKPVIFQKGFDGSLLNPTAYRRIVKEGATNLVQREKIGELGYMATYMPMTLENGNRYVLNIPYFVKNEEMNMDIMLFVVIAVNIAVIVMVLAFLLSGLVAERITKPLQMVNDKLRLMRVGGKNEKIDYDQDDEVGMLVKGYNEMVDKLDENVKKLAKSERESAWREMARQIAHEIKNPLTPMKLNIQFLQRTLQGRDVNEVKQRFKDISAVLIEQIDHMASIASAFSDFAKIPIGKSELFCLSELTANCVKLFEKNVDFMRCEIEPNVYIYGDQEQVNCVLVNLLKNAEQSIPDGQKGVIVVTLLQKGENVILTVRDNGIGISEENREHVSEPNFTTKSGGMGLGLAMSYKIIESMGGSISFESKEGEGTVFYVTLRRVEK